MTFDPEDPRRQNRLPDDDDQTPTGDDRALSRPPLLQPRRTPSRRSAPVSGEVILPDEGSEYPRRNFPAYEAAESPSLLGNPYMLAGLAVAGAIVLAVIVVFFFGSSGGGGGEASDGNGVVVDPLTPLPGRGITARSIATATVREGPSAEYVEIGLLRSNQDVEVVGRNNDSTWFQIYYPPRSQLLGWVAASALRLPSGSGPTLPVVSVTPIPRPTVIIPTPTESPPETPTPTVTVTGTATPNVGPDLSISVVPGSCAPNTRLLVSVKNNGPATITSRAITVLVQTVDGAQRAIAAQTANLAPNAVIDIDTGYTVIERVVITVDPLKTLGDPNDGNNRVDCVVVGTFPTLTPVPGQQTPTPTRTPRP